MNPTIEGVVYRLGWALVNATWQGAAVAVGLAVALVVLRRRSASARSRAAAIALGALVALPIATFALSGRGSIEPPLVRAATPARGPTIASPPSGSLPTAGSLRAIATLAEPTPADRINAYLPFAVAVWLAGVAILSVRWAGGWVVVRGWRRRGRPLDGPEWAARVGQLAGMLGVRRAVLLVESAGATVPMVVGWLRPVILLPASALVGLSPRQLDLILAHELAHVGRLDGLTNWLACAAETLLFFHPASWWAASRWRAEREDACDDLVIARLGDRLAYARALAFLEEIRPRPSPRLVAAATGGSLLHRIRRIIGAAPPAPPRRPAGPWLLCSTAALVAFVAGGIAAGDDPKSKRHDPAQLREAYRRIESIIEAGDVGDDPVSRSQALCTAAAQLAIAGQAEAADSAFARARASIDAQTDPGPKAWAEFSLAKALRLSGRAAEAKVALGASMASYQAMNDPAATYLLNRLAEEYVALGDGAAISKLAESIEAGYQKEPEGGPRFYGVIGAAASFARAGRFDRAFRLLDAEPEPAPPDEAGRSVASPRLFALQAIAEACAFSADPKAARAALDEVARRVDDGPDDHSANRDTPRPEIVHALAKLGDFEAARQAAAAIGPELASFKAGALLKVADEAWTAKNPVEMRRALEEAQGAAMLTSDGPEGAENTSPRAGSMAGVARGFAQLGDIAAVRHVVDLLGGEALGSAPLEWLANSVADGGAEDEARKLYEQALAAARRQLESKPAALADDRPGFVINHQPVDDLTPEQRRRDEIVATMARVQDRLGNLELARETAATIVGPYNRCRALAALARQRADAGDLAAALRDVEAIADPADRARALYLVVMRLEFAEKPR